MEAPEALDHHDFSLPDDLERIGEDEQRAQSEDDNDRDTDRHSYSKRGPR